MASPLPESDYTARGACAAPEPGYASCLALELVPTAASARAQAFPLTAENSPRSGLQTVAECATKYPSACLTPRNLQSAYFPSEEPEAPASKVQTIALVDAYNDPKAEDDLGVYDEQFHLPAIHACGTSGGGCFEQVNQSGTTKLPFPQSETVRRAKEVICVTAKAKESLLELEKREEACEELVDAEGWAIEISTDIEMAHAICQNCKILLVEAETPSVENLETAEETAVRLGATEISDSWGGTEEGFNPHAFEHPHTVITAAAGDDGYLNWTDAGGTKKEQEESGYFAGADYPAASPDVVAVGGTKLTMDNGARANETVWNEDPDPEGQNQGAGGGGCSQLFTAPPWQQAVPDWSAVGCGTKRAVADVSADADPYTGVAVYDSVPTLHEEATGEEVNTPLEWWPIGGTSVASPIIASMYALAGGAQGIEYPAETLYSHLGSSLLHDVTSGGNGHCDGDYVSCSGTMNPLSPLDCGVNVWICNATTGYDGPTGVGTPSGLGAFKVIEAPAKAIEEGKPTSKLAEEQSQLSGAGSAGGSEGSGTGGSSSFNGGKVTPLGTEVKPGSGPPRISAFALTANARAAVRHTRPTISQLAFSCKLSLAATVRATLMVQVRSGHHARWRALPSMFTFAAVKGLNRRHLHGSAGLAPGLYRLTLTPAGGTARSISIRVA